MLPVQQALPELQALLARLVQPGLQAQMELMAQQVLPVQQARPELQV